MPEKTPERTSRSVKTPDPEVVETEEVEVVLATPEKYPLGNQRFLKRRSLKLFFPHLRKHPLRNQNQNVYYLKRKLKIKKIQSVMYVIKHS